MNVNPVFNGKIRVTSVNDNGRSAYEVETSKSADKEILKTAREILPKAQTIYTQIIPKEKGERFISVLEKETGEKFDIPNDVLYSTLYYEGYNKKEDKSVTSIFFHCEEKYGKKGKMLGDSISIDINI